MTKGINKEILLFHVWKALTKGEPGVSSTKVLKIVIKMIVDLKY